MAAAKVVGSGICDRVRHGCGGLSYRGGWAMVTGGTTGGVDRQWVVALTMSTGAVARVWRGQREDVGGKNWFGGKIVNKT